MQSTPITFGIDWDDVIAPLNPIAVKLHNQKTGEHLTTDILTHWNDGGKILGHIYRSMELYENQEPTPKAIRLIHKLESIGTVYIATHPFSHVEPFRKQQIHMTFPELPENQIIIGPGKENIPFTFLLDDNLRTIQTSRATYPVLLDQTWNQESKDSKYLPVTRIYHLDEFLSFVHYKLKGENYGTQI